MATFTSTSLRDPSLVGTYAMRWLVAKYTAEKQKALLPRAKLQDKMYEFIRKLAPRIIHILQLAEDASFLNVNWPPFPTPSPSNLFVVQQPPKIPIRCRREYAKYSRTGIWTKALVHMRHCIIWKPLSWGPETNCSSTIGPEEFEGAISGTRPIPIQPHICRHQTYHSGPTTHSAPSASSASLSLWPCTTQVYDLDAADKHGNTTLD